MVVCVCRRVSDHQIRAQVAEGAGTLREISRSLGVGSQCGRCVGCAREIIAEARGSGPSIAPPTPLLADPAPAR